MYLCPLQETPWRTMQCFDLCLVTQRSRRQSNELKLKLLLSKKERIWREGENMDTEKC